MSGLILRVYLEKGSKDPKKNNTKQERMKAYEGLAFTALHT